MKPLLFLIPGMSNTPAVFSMVHRDLAALADCRITDPRGPDSIAEMAARCWRELEASSPHQPLLIAGFSMGGYVALQMLATAPRPIAGLAMIASSAHPERAEALPMRERAIASAGRDWDRYCEKICDFLIGPPAQADASLKAAILADLKAAGAEATIAQMRAVSARSDHRELLVRLMPDLLVIAAEKDPLIPLDDARDLARRVPSAHLAIIEGAGHLLPWEHPQPLAEQLAAWIARAPAARRT